MNQLMQNDGRCVLPWRHVAVSALVMLLATSAAPVALAALTPSNDDLRVEYEFARANVERLWEYHTCQIVVADEVAARSVIARLAAGESYEALAAELSIDPASKHKGGDLGWAIPQTYVPEVEKALLEMKAGEVSKEPVKTKLGWHVLKVLEIRHPHWPEFSAPDSTVQEYHAKEILLSDARVAAGLITRIKAGESFEKLASTMSVSQSERDQGGDLGWALPSSYVPEFGNALKAMKPGEISQAPVHSAFGWHVIKLVETRQIMVPAKSDEVAKVSKSVRARFDKIDQLASRIRTAAIEGARTEYRYNQILTYDEADINTAFARIHNGEDFGAVARSMSRDKASAVRGGEVDWVTGDKLAPVVHNMLDSLGDGEMSPEPFSTGYMWVLVVKLESRNAGPEVRTKDQAELDKLMFEMPNGPAVLREILKAGGYVNAVSDKMTPLAWQCWFGDAETVKLLLDAGASANAVTGESSSPLINCAVGADVPHNLPLLLSAGARVDAEDSFGNTPLIAMSRRNNVEALRQILAAGAPVNQRNKNGMTALAFAASSDNVDNVRLLLDNGADPLAELGKHPPMGTSTTALSMARVYEQREHKTSKVLPMLLDAATAKSVAASRRSVQVQIEQDGKRQPLGGKPVLLKRAPFRMIFMTRNGNDVMVQATSNPETFRSMQSNNVDGKFGNDEFDVKNEFGHDTSLTVSDGADFSFHHWTASSHLSGIEVPADAKGELKAKRDVTMLKYASSSGTSAVDVGQATGPIYLSVAVGDSIGAPYFAIKQKVVGEIRWR